MRLHNELFQGLLAGLPDGEQDQVLVAIRRTHREQLSLAIAAPPQRRRRGADGILRASADGAAAEHRVDDGDPSVPHPSTV